MPMRSMVRTMKTVAGIFRVRPLMFKVFPQHDG